MNTLSTNRIDCHVRLRQTSGREILYGITSPRTGRTLEVARRFLADLPRLQGRIVQAISRGMVAAFTVAELKAFAAAAEAQAQPRPLRYWGSRRRIGHRRAWR